MPKFVFAYHGGEKPQTPEQIEQVMSAWKSWMETNAASLADMGNPVGPSKTVTADGVMDDGGSNPLGGYTLVNAADMDAAVEIAKGCPILASNGTVEVAEAIEM